MHVAFHIVGMIIGGLIVVRRARHAGINVGIKFFGSLVAILLIGIAGARLGYVLSDAPYYATHWQEIFSLYGTIIPGALMLGIPALAGVARYLRVPYWKLADMMAPGVVLGQAIGRLGCLVAGSCYGLPAQVQLPGLETELSFRYPTQLMHSGANLLIFAVLLNLERRNISPFDGFIALTYTLLYFTQRLLIDFLRATGPVFASGMPFAGIRVPRVLSLAMIVAVLIALAWKGVRARRRAYKIRSAARQARSQHDRPGSAGKLDETYQPAP